MQCRPPEKRERHTKKWTIKRRQVIRHRTQLERPPTKPKITTVSFHYLPWGVGVALSDQPGTQPVISVTVRGERLVNAFTARVHLNGLKGHIFKRPRTAIQDYRLIGISHSFRYFFFHRSLIDFRSINGGNDFGWKKDQISWVALWIWFHVSLCATSNSVKPSKNQLIFEEI